MLYRCWDSHVLGCSATTRRRWEYAPYWDFHVLGCSATRQRRWVICALLRFSCAQLFCDSLRVTVLSDMHPIEIFMSLMWSVVLRHTNLWPGHMGTDTNPWPGSTGPGLVRVWDVRPLPLPLETLGINPWVFPTLGHSLTLNGYWHLFPEA